MLSFSGWNALGAFAMVCRGQGVAFVINIFWGTAINAVYGIANQVNGQLVYFSQMLTASFAPQITKSVGEGNFDKLRFLSLFSSKMSFFMSAVFAIPLILSIDYVLKIWLKDVPAFTNEFCTLIVYVFLILQLYPGINRAILAIGKIRNYQIVISVLLVAPIIGGTVLYKVGYNCYSICYVMIVAQTLSLVATAFYGRKYFNLDLKSYFSFVVKATFGFAIIILGYQLFLFQYFSQLSPFENFLSTTVFSMLVYSIYYCFIVLNRNERQRLINLLPKIKK